MPKYESVFIARADVSPARADEIADSFVKTITDAGGSVSKRENWGLRSLADKIKKNKKGHYVLSHIETDPKTLAEAEKGLRYNEDVLRYLTVRVEEFDAEPSPALRNREE